MVTLNNYLKNLVIELKGDVDNGVAGTAGDIPQFSDTSLFGEVGVATLPLTDVNTFSDKFYLS